MKVSKGTIIRTACLILTFANSALALFGKSPLPFDSEELTNVISWGCAFAASIAAWWKNNDFTLEAMKGTELMKKLKAEKGA